MVDTLICVTGASGFIAVHIVAQLLEKGYRVNGTVRSLDNVEEKYDFLLGLPNAEKNLKLFAANLLEEGSFDEAIAGCEIVIHTASPYVLTVNDPQKDLVDPAVKGTNNVLESCSKNDVKQVILTSSIAAITDSPINEKVYTEEDWNTESGLTRNPYYYSKTLAEKAAWKFHEESQTPFKLVVINPFIVVGPEFNKKGLNTSNAIFGKILDGTFGGILNIAWGIVDVRDVAKAHILAFERETSNGRYICCNETKTMTEVVDYLRPKYPNFNIPTLNLNSWFGTFVTKSMSYFQPSGLGQWIRTNIGRHPQIDNSKIKKDFDFEFMDVWQTIDDTCEDLISRGIVKPANTD